MITNALRWFERTHPFRIGLVLIVVVAALGLALFQKTRIQTAFSSGEELTVSFDRDYRMRAYVTRVKIAGVPVGLVTDVDHQDDGSVDVEMQVDDGIRERLRSTPSAAIRPTTLLGGNYYIDLRPGGDPAEFEGSIPAARTSHPVELDRVLEVFQPEARASLRRTVDRVERTLDDDGRRSVAELARGADDTLRPADEVLEALRGNRPARDLTLLVGGLEDTARALRAEEGRLDSALRGLSDVSSLLGDTGPEVARAVEQMPSTLATARRGLVSLDGTLDQVRAVADDARPAARALAPALEALEPALVELRPVVRDLRPALEDLRPLVDQLVPLAEDATGFLGDVEGAPLDRVRGPVIDVLNSDWHGTGDYAGGGNDTVFYREAGDFIAGMNNAGRMTDRNGSTIHFQPGFGVGSVSGTPISFEQLLKQLAYPGGSS